MLSEKGQGIHLGKLMVLCGELYGFGVERKVKINKLKKCFNSIYKEQKTFKVTKIHELA